MTVAQPASRIPYLLSVEQKSDSFEVDFVMYATDDAGIGTIFMPYIYEDSDFFLIPGTSTKFCTSREELIEFLKLENVPVKFDGKLQWSYSLREDLV
jgi:hypothetical protein